MALDVKYLRGTAAQYQAYLKANKIVSTTYYLIYPETVGIGDPLLYIGKVLLSEADEIAAIKAKIDAINIPEIPNITIIDDMSIADINITVTKNEGEEIVEEEVLGLVTVLKDIIVDEINGHTLKEVRVAIPTVAYIEDMIADITGGESAGDILAQLNDFKLEVSTIYTTKQELKDTKTEIVNIATIDAATKASTAEANAKAYTDAALTWQNMKNLTE